MTTRRPWRSAIPPTTSTRDRRSRLTSYSFRIVKNEQYSKVKAVIRDGVVETEQVSELHTPRFGWFPNQMGDADFHQGRIRLEIGPDGFASGLVGGYRDWRDLYSEDTFTQSGSTIETRDHHDVIGMYYALKRNADGMPDPGRARKWVFRSLRLEGGAGLCHRSGRRAFRHRAAG